MEKSNLSVYLVSLAVIIAAGLIGLAIWSQKGPAEEPNLNDNPEVGVGTLPALGEESAPITLVEFSDYQCSFCAKFLFETESRFREELVETGQMKIFWRDFVFGGQESIDAALAARCANEEGKFWQYHDLLFIAKHGEDQLAFNRENLALLAGALEINQEQFLACFDSQKYLSDVEADINAGRDLGIQGTPTLFINGEKVVGAQPYEVFKAVIDKYLK